MPLNANTVTVYFNSFDTEQGQDHVKIYDSQSMTLLADYSGYYPPDSPPPPVTSESGKIFFLFHSDEGGRAQGWDAGYYSDLVSIKENKETSRIRIYPVPAKDMVTIDFGESITPGTEIVLLNQTGQALQRKIIDRPAGTTTWLNVSNLSHGIYFIRITHGSKQEVMKVVI